MAATGNEVVILSQLKTLYDNVITRIREKLTTPTTEGSAGDVLTTDGAGTYSWTTPSTGTVYEGTPPIVVTGSNISVNSATETSEGVVSFASDSDFSEYMGL